MAENSASGSGERPFAGQHAIVTGGGRGIGAAIADELARGGANLTLMGRSQPAIDAKCAEIGRRFAVESRAVAIDVGDPARIQAAFAAAAAGLGPASILVNNAGMALSAPLHRTDLELWNSTMATNLTGVFLCMKAALGAMVEARYGRIVNIASTSGLIGYPYIAAYCASKHGVIGLTRSAALEVARRGITVNAVCPGYTETDILTHTVDNIVSKTGRSAEEARAELVRPNPQARFVRPEEVARAVAWLCLPGSAAVNGQAIPVDGGEVMK